MRFVRKRPILSGSAPFPFFRPFSKNRTCATFFSRPILTAFPGRTPFSGFDYKMEPVQAVPALCLLAHILLCILLKHLLEVSRNNRVVILVDVGKLRLNVGNKDVQ